MQVFQGNHHIQVESYELPSSVYELLCHETAPMLAEIPIALLLAKV